MVAIAAAEDKTKLFDFSFDLTKATVWGFLFLVLFDVVLTFPKDQVLMQRVLSTESAKEASRSVWTFAAIMIPGGFMFYMVGTALYAFYKTHPERLNPLLPIDSIFPLFIAAELPMGVRGLIIAGILAAAMATLSSIMNSVATLASVDFYEKWVKNPDPKVSVRFAEWMTVATGLAGMGLALILSRYDIHSLFDVLDRARGVVGWRFRRRLHVRHVHATCKLAGCGRWHRHEHRDNYDRVVDESGPSLLLSGGFHPAVYLHRLRREPVLPGAERAVAGRLDDLR